MPAGAVAGGTAIYGAINANQAAGQQSSAMALQQQAAQQQLALEQQFMRQQQGLYGPLERQLVQQASSTQPLDYGMLAGNIQNQYGAAGRDLQASLASRGLSGSGLATGATTGLEIGRANALASAFQQGLDRRRQFATGILSRYNPGANVQGVAGAYGNLQGLYGQYAGMYGQAAQQGYGQAAQGLGNLATYATSAMQPQAAPPQGFTDEGMGVTPSSGDASQYLPYLSRMAQAPQQPFPQTTPFGAGGFGGYFPQGPAPFDYSGVGFPTVTLGTGTNTNTYGL